MSQVPSIYGPRQNPMDLIGQRDFTGGSIYPEQAVVYGSATPLADQLQDTLRATAGAFLQGVSSVQQRRNIDIDNAERTIEQAKAEQEIVIGEARRTARMRLTDIQTAIDSGRIARGQGESYEDFAARVALEESDGMGELYTRAFADTIGPQLAQYAQASDERRVSEARAASVQVLADSASLAATSDDVSNAINAAEALGLRRDQATRAVGLTALQAAAQAGDRVRFDRVKAALGSELVQEQEALGIQLGERERAIASQRRNDFLDNLALVSLSGGGFGEQLALVAEGLTGGTIDPSTAERLTSEIQNSMAAQEKAQLVQADREQEAANVAGLTADLFALSTVAGAGPNDPNAPLAGGIASITDDQDFEFTLPSGKVQTVKGRDVRRAVTAKAMQAIGEAAPDPATALRRQAQWLGFNNVKHDPLATQLTGGVSQAITALTATPGSGQSPEVPASTIDAYRTATVLQATSPSVYERHTTESDRAFYDAVRLGMESGKDEQQAIVAAARAAASPLRYQPMDLSKRMVWNRAIALDAMQARNASVVESYLNQLTRYYVASTGMTVDRAADLAIEKVEQQFPVHRGVAVSVAGLAPIARESLPDVLGQLAGEYAAKYGEAEGIEADDIAWDRDARSGTWRAVNARTMTTLMNNDEFGFVDDQRLVKMASDNANKAKAAQREASMKAVQRELDRRANPQQSRTLYRENLTRQGNREP
jgi:hypothetical protein